MNSRVCVDFNVKTNSKNGEVVCVTGDIPELGCWKYQAVVPLRLERKLGDGSEVWSKSINMKWREEVHYRFLKAHIIEPQHEGDNKDLMITSWETNIKPRVFKFAGPSEDSEELPTYGTYDGRTCLDRAWLTGQTEVRLRLHSNPMTMWKTRHQQQTYRIKCTPVDLKHHDDDDSSDEEMHMSPDEEESNHDLLTLGGANCISISVYRDDLMVPHDQPQFGTIYRENDYMVFRAQTFELDTLGFQFDFYVSHPNAKDMEIPKHVGSAYILPINLNETTAIKNIPISGLKHKPIGQLRVDYLIVRSMPDDLSDMSVSYARHWGPEEPIDVGHRGLGSTYEQPRVPGSGSPRKCEVVKENTIASLSEAGGHGAHFVEFDVHLSRDGVPVIYHDFVVGLSLKQKKGQDPQVFKIPLHELSLDQLHLLKIHHGDHPSHDHADASTEVDEGIDERPFPTLKECFERIDSNIGFNVEIKYCMPLRQGGLEMDVKHYRERNNYIDAILREVLLHAGQRSIVFSCFDPDVCTMIRLKQNKYPVLQLCNNPRPEWPDYRDSRTWSNSCALAHCVSEQLLGVNPNTLDLLNKPDLVQEAKGQGLVVFCWGEETNSKETIAKVKRLGVDGVIYDKIHELKVLSADNMFTMDDADQEMALLTDVGAVSESTASSLMLTKTDSRSNRASDVNSLNGSNPGFSGLIPASDSVTSKE